jgi:hypothetical protein
MSDLNTNNTKANGGAQDFSTLNNSKISGIPSEAGILLGKIDGFCQRFAKEDDQGGTLEEFAAFVSAKFANLDPNRVV